MNLKQNQTFELQNFFRADISTFFFFLEQGIFSIVNRFKWDEKLENFNKSFNKIGTLHLGRV